MTQEDILMYLSLVDRRVQIVLDSGINWKPEYEKELAYIDEQLADFRYLIDQEYAKRQ